MTDLTSREIVQKTLNFEGPSRVAHSFAPSDILSVGPDLPEGEWTELGGGRWERVDAWGNVWGRVDAHSKGEVVRGALEDLDTVETFPLPDFDQEAVYASARAAFAAEPDRWHAGFVHGFSFSMARKLRRLDRYFIDLLQSPEQITMLHDRIDEQIHHQIRHMAAAGADCIFFAEDWGTQANMFISPRMWRAEFKPRFVSLCAAAHDLGLKVFMHSCGKITSIIPDLIEAGVSVFQFDQPRVHGLDTLAAFRDEHRVTFWCPVDIQEVLPKSDAELVRREAQTMLDVLWRGEGGFIAGWYPDPPALGITAEWQAMANEVFLTHGTSVKN